MVGGRAFLLQPDSSRQMVGHRDFCRVLARQMHARGFAPTDTVRKLYRSA